MFKLPLRDPLWRKLDDAHRDRDIPAVLKSLSLEWEQDAATSLLWDCLCHQDTCYGATYAAIPHLMEIMEAPPSSNAQEELAHFLTHVSEVAFISSKCCGRNEADTVLDGLPLHISGWERKLDVYRSLAEHARRDLADPEYPENLLKQPEPTQHAPDLEVLNGALSTLRQWLSDSFGIEEIDPPDLPTREQRQRDLERYEAILSSPMKESDLPILQRINDAFLEARPRIAVICARA